MALIYTPLSREQGIDEAIQWVKDLLRTQAEDAKLERFVSSALRSIATSHPGLLTYAPDFSGLTADDSAALWEAVGYEAASVLVRTPREEGDEIIIESEISSIREKYQVAPIKDLGDYLSGKAESILYSLSIDIDTDPNAVDNGSNSGFGFVKSVKPTITEAKREGYGLYYDLLLSQRELNGNDTVGTSRFTY